MSDLYEGPDMTEREQIQQLQAEVERLTARESELFRKVSISDGNCSNLEATVMRLKREKGSAEQRADQLQRERDELERSMVKVECECIDVLFDFAADRDSRGIVLPLCDQSSPIAEAMRVADEQLRKGGGDND